MEKSYYKSPIGILEIICENDALISLKLVKNADKSSNETILIKEIRRQLFEYFSGKKGLIPYRVLYIVVAAIAPVVTLDVVWALADILNALMAIPNLIAVILLSNVISKETKKYINDLDKWDEADVPIVDD